jgi:hypothetical protein
VSGIFHFWLSPEGHARAASRRIKVTLHQRGPAWFETRAKSALLTMRVESEYDA